MPVASGILVWWPGTAASIPSGWTREATMDTRYGKGAPNAIDPDVTGGLATHGHTTPSHSHAIASHTHPSGAVSGPASGTEGATPGGSVASDDHTHTLNVSSATAGTSGTRSASWQTANNDPSFFEMILIESDGTPDGTPDGAVVFYNSSSAPSGWGQHSGSDEAFIKAPTGGGNGGGTGGGSHVHVADAHNHSKNHTHTVASGNNSGTDQDGDSSITLADTPHTHTSGSLTITGDLPNGTSANATGTTYEPSFHTLLLIENTSGGDLSTSAIIAMWLGTLASIPDRWILCNGGSGTPDLRDKYVKGAAVGGGDVGSTGGSDGHDHTDPAGHTHGVHDHVANLASPGSNGTPGGGFGGSQGTLNAHSHGGTNSNTGGASDTGVQTVDSEADTQPLFRTVAYLQFEGLLPTGAGALMY